MRTPISPDDLELLSAYLDGELPESARAALESRLDAEPALRDALDDLRRTVQILQAAPAIKPPRSFTLNPARYRRRAPWWARYNTMRMVGALGAFASVVLIALGVFSMSLSGNPAPAQNAAGIAFAASATSGVQDKTFSAEAASSIPSELPPTATVIQITASPTAAAAVAQAALPTATLLPTSIAAAYATPQPAPVLPTTNEPAASGGAVAPFQPRPTQILPSTQAAAAANAPESGAGGQPGVQNGQGEATLGEQTSDSAQSPEQRQPKQQPSVQALATLPTTVPPTSTSEQNTRAATASQIGKDEESMTPSPTQGQAVAQVPTTAPSLPRDQQGAAFARSGAASQLLLISGIALLIFSSMLYAIGWMRSRL